MSEKVRKVMERGIEEGIFPGAQLLVSRKDRILHEGAYGGIDYETGERVTRETVYDLASLTKPLGTALAVMRLRDMGMMRLKGRLSDYLPGFRAAGSGEAGVLRLLTHSAGFPAHRPYYELLEKMEMPLRREALTRLIMEEPPEYLPGTDVIYSDLGFMVLAMAVEAVAGIPLDRFLTEEVHGPLGAGGLHFPGTGGGLPGRVYAPTERCQRRKLLIKGAVHDDNAYALGGVCGHAGLFGTASEVHRLLGALWTSYAGGGGAGVFSEESVRRFLAPEEKTGRTPGFDIPSGPVSSSGTRFSRNTVGHLGFTGTSFWMDLDRGITVVLLTNRVHPVRANMGIKSFRPLIHDTVMEAVESGDLS